MKREDFETLAHPILEQVRDLCERALVDADISTDKLSALEVVGSGSRVPAILKILSNVFQKEPRRTMNASESVGRGCALRCAMLSPTFRVREFVVCTCYIPLVCCSHKIMICLTTGVLSFTFTADYDMF
jgi:heat shock protein 4